MATCTDLSIFFQTYSQNEDTSLVDCYLKKNPLLVIDD